MAATDSFNHAFICVPMSLIALLVVLQWKQYSFFFFFFLFSLPVVNHRPNQPQALLIQAHSINVWSGLCYLHIWITLAIPQQVRRGRIDEGALRPG